MDVAEIDVFGVIMVVAEGVYEGEIGFVVEIFDYGMGVYCEVYEWVLWVVVFGEGKMEVFLNSSNMEYYVLVEVVEL